MGAAPDQFERDRATDITRSVIVQAPAGSGKTTLLVERYLRLLAVVSKPEEILAITFTRKAASEMQNRVLEALEAADRANPASGPLTQAATVALRRSAEQNWNLLEQPARLKIQTIDSFALSLARGLPLASGFDPALALTESATDLYREAANRLLMRLYAGESDVDVIADFLRQCDNDGNRAERLLTAMLGKRDQWLEAISGVVVTASDQPERLARVLEQGVETLNAEIIERFRQAVGESLSAELEMLVDHAASVLGRDLTDQSARYRLAGEILTTMKGQFRKQVTRREGFGTDFPDLKARLMDVISQIAVLNLERQVANLRHLPEPAFDAEAVGRLVTVCINLALANGELTDTFRRAQTSDFTSLILSAQSALGEDLAPSELALALDYRIHHLLIDEFQDTSVSQFRLFEMLLSGWNPGDGNTFFAVGDPMQSIYRFRDADVSLFFRAWEQGIGELKPEPVVLASNFRSDPRLVTWTNHAFGRIMGAVEDPVLGQVGFRPAAPTRPPGSATDAATLSLHPTEASQADAVVDRIKRLLAGSEGSIALLVRSRSHLKPLLGRLRQADIAWHANDIDPLLDKPAVRDLLSLIGALQDPRDRLSWFSLCRTPLLGLTLVDLQSLAGVEDFPGFLKDPGDRLLSSSALTRLSRLSEAWSTAMGRIDEQPFRSVVETLWLRLGGADAYEDPDALNHATRLLELIDGFGSRSPTTQALRQAAINLFATDLTESPLQILTIHKAKGLEFDHVLVPFLERTTPANDSELLLWRALPGGMLMGIQNEPGPFAWLARENRFREQHERQRLLYVACTRARSTLSLFACASDKPSDASMLSQLQPMIETDDLGTMPCFRIEPAAPMTAQGDLFESRADVAGPPIQRLTDSYRWEAPRLTPLRIRPTTKISTQQDLLDRRFEVVLGIVVHSALERLADQPLPADPHAYVLQEEAHWRQLALGHELDPETARQVMVAASAQVLGVLGDSTGRWLLGAREQGRSELAVTGVIDGNIENLVIDRTFVADGRRWIVDYKTSVPPPGIDPDAFVRLEQGRYTAQLDRYAGVAAALFGQSTHRAIYFTAIPRLVELF